MRAVPDTGTISIAIVASLLLMSANPAAAHPADFMQVKCAQGRSFFLRIEKKQAIIRSGAVQMRLDRRSSALGQQFESEAATLIIDGDFVAFVPKGDPSWRDCRIEAATEASPHP